MKKLGWVLGLLSCGLLYPSAESKEIKTLFAQAKPYVWEEVQQQVLFLPEDLLWITPEIKLSSRRTGALAEYDARRGKILFFRKHIAQWAAHTSQPTPAMLARCLAPLYVHELSHARDQYAARQHHLAWPVTLEDEWVASFWQLAFMQKHMQANSHYYAECAPLLPPAVYRDIAACDAQDAIYRYYAAVSRGTVPPPLTQPHIQTLQKDGEVFFAGQFFTPKRRLLSLHKFFTRGGNWLQLTPKALSRLPEEALFDVWLGINARRTQQILAHCVEK